MIEDIVHEATYAHPPERVWRAIATHEGLTAFLMVNDFKEAMAGHRFRFTDRPRPFWDGICDCEVAEAEPARRFVLRWGVGGKGAPSTVSWALEPTATGGTRVQFRHAGLTGVMGWFMKKGMTKGWKRMLDRSIPVILEGLATRGQIPSRDEVARAASCR